MKSTLFLTTSGMFLAFSWANLPSFDWEAALRVGGIVALGAVVVIVAAIAIPGIGIVAGAGILKTALEVAGMAVAIGIIGGIAAGFYWGRMGDVQKQEKIEMIKHVSNQLDIHFEASNADPNRATDFQCTLVIYEARDLTSRQPTVSTRKLKITAADSEQFYGQVEEQMKAWFTKPVLGDDAGQPRRVKVYMKPYPGEGTYERIKERAENNGIRRCNVIRSDSEWESALP